MNVSNSLKEETYFSSQIYGNGLEDLPILCSHKKGRNDYVKKQIIDPLVSYIDLEPHGIGDYYGFTIDGNHRK